MASLLWSSIVGLSIILLASSSDAAAEVICSRYNVTSGPDVDVVFNCQRSTTEKTSIPIKIEYAHPFIEASNAEVKSWFGDLKDGVISENYEITITKMKAGRYDYYIVLQSERKPRTQIKVFIDAPVVSEDSRPYNKVMRVGETVDNFLPCNMRNDLGTASYRMKWEKQQGTALSGGLCFWNQYGLLDRVSCAPHRERWFTLRDRFSLVFRDVSLDHAGQYTCDVDIGHPAIKEEYHAEVTITESTKCSSSYAYEGETVYLRCSVSYRGNGTSILRITDIDGKIPTGSSPTELRLSGGDPSTETHEVILGVRGLPAGKHTYLCKNTFSGMEFEDPGCAIDVVIYSNSAPEITAGGGNEGGHEIPHQ